MKPIIKEELEQFSSKVDKIVSYLTNKRKEERIEQNYVDMDFQALRSHTYEQVVQQEREQMEQHVNKQVVKQQMLDRRKNYSKYVT